MSLAQRLKVFSINPWLQVQRFPTIMMSSQINCYNELNPNKFEKKVSFNFKIYWHKFPYEGETLHKQLITLLQTRKQYRTFPTESFTDSSSPILSQSSTKLIDCA